MNADIGESAEDNGEPRCIDIFNGADDHLGYVAVGRSIRACRVDGSEIGAFPTIEEARAAIVRAAFSNIPGADLSAADTSSSAVVAHEAQGDAFAKDK